MDQTFELVVGVGSTARSGKRLRGTRIVYAVGKAGLDTEMPLLDRFTDISTAKVRGAWER